ARWLSDGTRGDLRGPGANLRKRSPRAECRRGQGQDPRPPGARRKRADLAGRKGAAPALKILIVFPPFDAAGEGTCEPVFGIRPSSWRSSLERLRLRRPRPRHL